MDVKLTFEEAVQGTIQKMENILNILHQSEDHSVPCEAVLRLGDICSLCRKYRMGLMIVSCDKCPIMIESRVICLRHPFFLELRDAVETGNGKLAQECIRIKILPELKKLLKLKSKYGE